MCICMFLDELKPFRGPDLWSEVYVCCSSLLWSLEVWISCLSRHISEYSLSISCFYYALLYMSLLSTAWIFGIGFDFCKRSSSTSLRAEVPHLYRDAFVPQVLDVDIIGATGSRCYNSGSAGGIPWPTFRWCLWWWFWGNSKWNGWQVDSSYSSMVFWLIDFGPTSLVDLDDWHQIEGLWVAHIQNDMIGSPKCGRHLTAVNKHQKLQGSPGPSFVEGVECWIVPEMGKKEAAWLWSVSRNDRTGMSWTVMKHPNCHHGWITSY